MAERPAVLLIEDDWAIRQVLADALGDEGYLVRGAADGRAALDILAAWRPDAILLDLMMPGMDGFDVLKALKAQPETRNTLVIFLSARGEVTDKVSGLELGAIDYITKPIQGEEVLARVAVHLSRQHLEREVRKSRDRLDKELAGAAHMQRLLLPPQMPPHPAIKFASFYQTSRHAGGDYYDVLPLPGDRIGVLVADVSGHGAPAAIVMAMIRAVVHTYPGVPDDPPAVLRYINRHFEFLWDTPMYATAVYAVIDAKRKKVALSSAGHPLPLKASPTGDVASPALDTTMCLLWQELDKVPSIEVPLEVGDRWAFFTDGITDRGGADGSMFELERLSAALATHRGDAPLAIVNGIVRELEEFSAGQEPDDDQTLVVFGVD